MSYAKRQGEKKRVEKLHTKLNGSGFAPLRYDVLRSDQWRDLSPNAVKLLTYFMSKYTGKNNGDFSAPKNRSDDVGMSPNTLEKSKAELIEKGFLVISRQGGRNQCSLFAITFWSIDECLHPNGYSKIDIPPTRTAPDDWKKKQESTV